MFMGYGQLSRDQENNTDNKTSSVGISNAGMKPCSNASLFGSGEVSGAVPEKHPENNPTFSMFGSNVNTAT
jgi:hypothetical protein